MSDKLFHLVMAAISLVIAYCCLAMASKWDDISNNQYKEYCEKENERMQDKAQKSYERYRQRFANDNGLTIEQATEYQAVKNYKAYLEEQYAEHGVQICEKVGE